MHTIVCESNKTSVKIIKPSQGWPRYVLVQLRGIMYLSLVNTISELLNSKWHRELCETWETGSPNFNI